MNLEMNRNTPQTAQMQDCQEEEVDRAMDQYFLDDLSRILSEPGGPESESASNDGQSELDVASDSESGTETVDSAICMSRDKAHRGIAPNSSVDESSHLERLVLMLPLCFISL
jgi:hypothetical protein